MRYWVVAARYGSRDTAVTTRSWGRCRQTELADIYLGQIRKWNDPILTRVNRGLYLPDLDIVVVHRADGSGTSYAWTDYLSKVSPAWKTQVGTSLSPKWPTEIGRAHV